MNRREMLKYFSCAALAAGVATNGLGAPTEGLAAGGQPAGAAPASADASNKWWSPAGRDALDVIHERRSHRGFTGEDLPFSALEAILSAGMSAPSAHNSQPWQFTVLREKDEIRRMALIVGKASFITTAGVVLVPSGDSNLMPDRDALLYSMACCNMNILLASEALGYGSVWIEIVEGSDRQAMVRDFLKLPPNLIPISIMPIGRPQDKIEPENRYKKERVHYGKWAG